MLSAPSFELGNCRFFWAFFEKPLRGVMIFRRPLPTPLEFEFEINSRCSTDCWADRNWNSSVVLFCLGGGAEDTPLFWVVVVDCVGGQLLVERTHFPLVLLPLRLLRPSEVEDESWACSPPPPPLRLLT